MRRLLVNIHLYAGLFCSSMIMMIGINSFMRNHHLPESRDPVAITNWQQQLPPEIAHSETLLEQNTQLFELWAEIKQLRDEKASPEDLKPLQQKANTLRKAAWIDPAHAVRENLGIAGWVLNRTIKRTESGDLSFEIFRPGKQYHLTLPVDSDTIQVEDKRLSVWIPIYALHGFMGMPGSTLATVYGWYTELSVWAFVIMTVTSLVIWQYRKKQRRYGLVILVTAVVISSAMIIYIITIG